MHEQFDLPFPHHVFGVLSVVRVPSSANTLAEGSANVMCSVPSFWRATGLLPDGLLGTLSYKVEDYYEKGSQGT
ncbi:hypothetical protein AB1N83_004847 [Pleurotus pulmonarius]